MRVTVTKNNMPRKIKLLVVGSFLSERRHVFGGIARSCQTMMNSSFKDRFDIIPVDSTQISNPPPGLILRFVFAFKRITQYIYKLIRFRPDCVLLFTGFGVSFVEKCILGWISRFFGYPVLIFPRGGKLIDQVTQSVFKRLLARVLLKGSSVFLAQGPKWREFAIDDMGFDNKKVHVITNWTATENHLKIGAKREFNSHTTNLRLLFVGWLEEFKGVFELLLTCRELVSRGIKFKLTFAGGGQAEEKAKRFVKENKLEEVVSFSGWADAAELEDLLTSNDIFVLPSWAEGMPNSMIEAMAAGLAAVVTTVGMIPDFIRDGEQAIMVPPHNVNSLTEALHKVIVDQNLRKKLAINGHMMAKKQFAVEPTIKKLGDIVEATIVR